ncbi:MFS transporter [Paraburkholderia sp. RL17-337-BIB-A]|uniref:MFS transporter n=1 Tax=Paraburkholderia sp. RL17-337-BIB-A TaxID=3031636 RepID=UPI0038B90D76
MATTNHIAVVEAQTAVRWKIFFVILSLVSLNYLDRASISVAMPLIATEFHLSPALQGLIMSMFFWSYALMQIPGGMLADRYKPRVVIATATVIWGVCQTLVAACTNTAGLILTRLGLGLAEAPLNPSSGKLNGIWLTPNERGRGAALLDGGAPLGAAIGSLIIATLIGWTGSWRLAFVVTGVVTILAGLFAWRFIRNSPRDHGGVSQAEAEYIELANQSDIDDEANLPPAQAINLLKHRTPWLMFLGYMFSNVVFFGLLTWMPNYLSKVHGFDIRQMGGASFVIFMTGFAGDLFGGWSADKLMSSGMAPNKVMRTLLGVASAVTTVAIFSVAFTTGPVVTVVLLSITLFFQRWTGLYWSMPAMLTTRRRSGLLGSVMNLGGQVGGVVVPLAIGLIVQLTGSYFIALMVFTGAGIGLFICSVSINYEKKVMV